MCSLILVLTSFRAVPVLGMKPVMEEASDVVGTDCGSGRVWLVKGEGEGAPHPPPHHR